MMPMATPTVVSSAPAAPNALHPVRALRSRRGFSILELIIAISLTMIIAVVVFQIYKIAIDSYIDIRGSIQNLQAYRNAVDKIEIEMSGIVAKGCYLPHNRNADGFKAVNSGLFQIRFLRHQLGFYTSTAPAKIDRVIYYHNRAEDEEKLSNNVDDDGDDPPPPMPPLGHFVDDNGYFMVWRRNDSDLGYDDYSAPITGTADKLDFVTANPLVALQPFFNPRLDQTGLNPSTFGSNEGTPAVAAAPDTGEILAKNVKRVTFAYVWTQKGVGGVGVDPKFQYANCWPVEDYDPVTGVQTDNLPDQDKTGYQYGVNIPGVPNFGDHRKGLSYLSLPIAVQISFEFIRNGDSEFLSKTIYIYRSSWNDYLGRSVP